MPHTTTTTNAPVATQTAHTPAPWQANPIGDTGRCSISAPHPSGGGQNVIDECLKENAALIAAAPELLAALESVAAGSVQDTGENGMGTVNIDRETMQLIARAAIAKATGGAK